MVTDKPRLPRTLPGFESIRRYRNSAHHGQEVVLQERQFLKGLEKTPVAGEIDLF